MKVQFYRPTGMVEIDPEKVTDSELVSLKLTRATLDQFKTRDILAEIDQLKADVAILKGV